MTYLLNYSADEVTVASPVAGEVVVAPVVIATDGNIDEAATAEVVLKEVQPSRRVIHWQSAAGMLW